MNKILRLLSAAIAGISAATSCSWQETTQPEATESDFSHESAQSIAVMTPSAGNEDPLWMRHHGASVKILAIGNSFATNATAFLPRFFNTINADSVFIAVMTHPGCSLRRHWANHTGDLEEYSLVYSDDGEWKESSVDTFDEAINLLDWDIITLQQDSGNSGDYSTYQPYLDDIIGLLRVTNPQVSLAWHMTWSYTPDCKYEEFSRYDYDWKKMYDAIMDAGSKIIGGFDFTINSASLIKEMRETFPEIQDGFSSDGRHVTDITAQYALSSLWYEVLVAPKAGISCLGMKSLPSGVNEGLMERIDSIIVNIIENPIGNGSDSVPMLHE